METTFRNKVAESGILTLDLAPFMPADESIASFDLKPFLFRELILREKDYRQALKEFDFSPYQGRHVALHCTADAIIPMWAYMLATSYLQPLAQSIHFGDENFVRQTVLLANIHAAVQPEDYQDKRVVLKGCGDVSISEAAYVAASSILLPVVKSLMYGEPCSTVPVYKQALRRD